MPDYSIEKYIISNNRILGYDDFYDFDRVKVVFIESDFDIDDDCSNHFMFMNDLERFDVLDNGSRFYTEDGVLFVNLRGNSRDRIRNKELFFYFPEDLTGKVLVAFPTNYPNKRYSIPQGTVAICRGAFEKTNIKELVLPDSIQYIDFHALEDTDCLTTLCVPDKMIEIMDHFKFGTKDDFKIISNNDNSYLSSEVLKMWENLTAPFIVDELPDDELGKRFRGEMATYPRYITWSDDKSEKELKAVISEKDSVFEYYSMHKDNKDRGTQNMLALLFYMVRPCILHPSSKAEAEILIDMMFGNKGLVTDWLKKYAGSPRDYKQLNRLLQSDPVVFFHYIRNSTVKKLFLERSKDLLMNLSEKNDIIAIPNLLAIVDDKHSVSWNADIIQKALTIHEPVTMWDMARFLFKMGGERAIKAKKLFHDLAYSENILPHPHIADIKRNALNNYMWIDRQKDINNAVLSLNEKRDATDDLPF